MGQLRLKGLILLFLLSAIFGLFACLGQSRESARAITVSPTNLTTSEDGSTATFTVSLNEAPAGNVVIDVVSTDASEVLVSNPATGGFAQYLTLTFTQTDWATPQTVIVQGVDDLDQDGNQNVAVTVNVNTSLTQDTTGYLGINPPDVSVTNIDDDRVGVTVTPTTLVTTEAGGTADFTVRLNKAPDGDVVIDVASSDLSEGTVAPAQLTFDVTNWSDAQTVTVTGVDDTIADGNQTYNVTVDINPGSTTDTTGYATINPTDVSVINTDNDTAGVTVNPPGGLATSEAGTTDSFAVVLNTQPDSDVTIDVVSLDLTEGTVAPAQLIFDTTNWSSPQTVTVTGQDDFIPDGNQTYAVRLTINTIATDYAAIAPIDVSVTNTDNDTAGVTVSPTSGLATSEAGTTDSFTVRLNTQPDGDVTIDVASLDETEGTVAPAQLIFDTTNWPTPQTVTVTGQDDFIVDGNQTYTVTVDVNGVLTTDTSGYATVNPDDVTVTNTDNDTAGVTVNPTGGLATSETGTTATFTVRLNSQPDSDVTIDVASLDETEGTVAPAQLIFDTTNWPTPQTVTVTGQDDFILDGNQTYAVRLTINTIATGYVAIAPIDVSVTNIDNDTAGVTVNPTSGLITSEAGTTATFTVVLNTQPTGGVGDDVTFDVRSSNEAEGTVAPAQLTFTQSDWQTPQTVTVTGQPDGVADTDQLYTVTVAISPSGTPPATGYNKVNPVDVTVTNINID